MQDINFYLSSKYFSCSNDIIQVQKLLLNQILKTQSHEINQLKLLHLQARRCPSKKSSIQAQSSFFMFSQIATNYYIYYIMRGEIIDSQALELNRRNLEKKIKLRRAKRLKQQKGDFINSNGIVSPSKLILIACLIVVSISTVVRANNTHWPHVKALTNYFNYFVLQQDDLSIYDRGDNLDETYLQITNYTAMKTHLQNLVNFVQNYTDNGFATFEDAVHQNVDMQYYYTNGTLIKKLKSFQQFKSEILNSDIRELLLSLRVLYFEINFGNNHLINEFKLIFDYEIYSQSLLKLDMSTKYKTKMYSGSLREQFVLRNLQRFFAMMLMISYSIEGRKIYYDKKMEKQFRKNSLNWCISLIVLNFVALVSDRLAPSCAVLQLLPIFENHDSSNTMQYNFNVNLRYAIPIVFRVLIPVYMIMNGFILYSMIMYPGDYFDDYITGFFSYFYNNFQYGIYEIFTEIKSRGNVAYLLYVILYFYMVLVGSNLTPALFCTLIFRKIAQKQLIRFIQNKLELIVCPACHSQNYQKQGYGFEISINSPKSPYLKSGTKVKHSLNLEQKITRMYIEQNQKDMMSPTLSPILSIKNKHKRSKNLILQLNSSIEYLSLCTDQFWVKKTLEQIQTALASF